MSERAKLSFDDLSKPKKRAKPDLAVLRQLSEDHGFPSRDPVPTQDGEGEELVGDAPPGPPPNCGRKCSSDSDCQTGGFVQYPTCYVNSGTMCHGYCGP